MRKIAVFGGLILCVVAVWHAALIGYGLEQGWGQLNIIWQARPVSEVLRDPHFADSLKHKLRLVERVRKFAVDSLGLHASNSYTTVFDQRGEEVMWVVTACKPFELVPKIWHFPFVGDVPYKGFFNREHAFDERTALREQGWDVGVSNPSGWSTLGLFDEPILSGMLHRSDGDLVNLIIHEMVHATIFVKDSATFNENLAVFIAGLGTDYFMAQEYGVHSVDYRLYRSSKADRQRYNDHMLRGLKALDSLYATFTPDDSFVYKRKQKTLLIRTIIHTLDSLSITRTSPLADRFKTALPNNTYFMTYRRYQSKIHRLRDELNTEYGGHLATMIRGYANTFPAL